MHPSNGLGDCHADSPPPDIDVGEAQVVHSSSMNSPGADYSSMGHHSSTRAATQRHQRQQQQQQVQQQPDPQQQQHRPLPLSKNASAGATAAVSISIPSRQQQHLLQQQYGKGFADGTFSPSSSAGGSSAFSRVQDALSRLWLRLVRRQQQHRLSEPHSRAPRRGFGPHSSSRLPRSVLLLGVLLLVLLPTVVLLRAATPRSSSSSSRFKHSSNPAAAAGDLITGKAGYADIIVERTDISSDDSISGGSAGSAAGTGAVIACIPPSRATPWDVALAAAAAAAATPAARDQVEQQQQQQQMGLGQQDVLNADQQVAGRKLRQQQQQQHVMAAGVSQGGPIFASSRHLQQQQQQKQPQTTLSKAVARQVALAALAVSGGNEVLAKSVLDDKVLLQTLVAGVHQATATENQQKQLLVQAAATPVPAVDAAGPADDVSNFHDAEAAAAASEPWPAGAAALAGAQGASTSGAVGSDGGAAGGDGDVTQYFDAEAAADLAVPLLKPVVTGTPQPDKAAGSSSSSSSSAANGGSTAATTTSAAAVDTSAQQATTATAAPRPVDADAAVPGVQAAGGDGTGGIDDLRIALVNDVEFHHEVTLGLMAALQKHKAQLKVYLHGSLFKAQQPGDSSFDFVSYVNRTMPGNTLVNAHDRSLITETDVAIFVSPEFNIKYYRSFLNAAKPRLVVVFIHEPNMALSRLQYIINMHPLVGVATLSPHVADVVRTRMRMNWVHWMMPVLPAVCSNDCWEGFAVQGKFEGSRRSYSELWRAMQQHLQEATGQRQLMMDEQQRPALLSSLQASFKHAQDHMRRSSWSSLPHLLQRWSGNRLTRTTATPSNASTTLGSDSHPRSTARSSNGNSGSSSSSNSGSSSSITRALQAAALPSSLPRINLLGSGDVTQLGLPVELQPDVKLYLGLGYEEYYDTLCRSLALLPLFNASSGYLRDKISSTVLTSIAVGVPMVVPPSFLSVYTEFKKEHVLVLDGQEATDAGAKGESSSTSGSALMKMLNVLSSTQAADLLRSKRRALDRLRYVLNHQATAKLDGLIIAAKGKPHAGAKQA